MFKPIIVEFFLFILLLNSWGVQATPYKPSINGKYNLGEISLYIECYGEQSPTIVVQSGFGGYGSEGKWNAVIEKISTKNRICLYDRANLGKSDKQSNAYNYKDAAQQLKSLLDKAKVKPPYLMVGHSLGSYPVRFYNHIYSNDVAGILLIDPSQYGMLSNRMTKWDAAKEIYSEDFEKRRQIELEFHTNPNNQGLNPERIDMQASAELLKETNDFGDLPFVLLWAKDGHYIGNKPPKSWHKDVWYRMAVMYKDSIDKMHKLSTDTSIVYAKTTEHETFFHEPGVVVEQLRYLINKINSDPKL